MVVTASRKDLFDARANYALRPQKETFLAAVISLLPVSLFFYTNTK